MEKTSLTITATNTIIIKKEMHDVKQKMKDAIIEVDIDE